MHFCINKVFIKKSTIVVINYNLQPLHDNAHEHYISTMTFRKKILPGIFEGVIKAI